MEVRDRRLDQDQGSTFQGSAFEGPDCKDGEKRIPGHGDRIGIYTCFPTSHTAHRSGGMRCRMSKLHKSPMEKKVCVHAARSRETFPTLTPSPFPIHHFSSTTSSTPPSFLLHHLVYSTTFITTKSMPFTSANSPAIGASSVRDLQLL